MTAAGRAPGWGTVALLALACAALSVVQPTVLIAVPLAVLLVAVPPLRLPHLLAGLLLGAMVFQGGVRHTLWFGGRGWVLVVAAWFLVAVLALPRAAFVNRAVAAVSAAAATAAVLLRAVPGTWDRIDWSVRTALWSAAGDTVAAAGALFGDRPWWPDATDMVYRFAAIQARLFPALLSLASLAGLAVAWFAFRRLARREATPLAPLREFRFRDELVWLLVAGVALTVLPTGDALLRTGVNLVVFMSGLYAVRGLGVMLALGGTPGAAGILLVMFAVLFLYPLVMAATLLVGVTDTWLDLRRRALAGDSGSGETGP